MNYFLFALIIFLLLLLIMRVSALNERMRDVEDYTTECVTKDGLKALVMSHISQTLEET